MFYYILELRYRYKVLKVRVDEGKDQLNSSNVECKKGHPTNLKPTLVTYIILMQRCRKCQKFSRDIHIHYLADIHIHYLVNTQFQYHQLK